jgi:hypothetical protein
MRLIACKASRKIPKSARKSAKEMNMDATEERDRRARHTFWFGTCPIANIDETLPSNGKICKKHTYL